MTYFVYHNDDYAEMGGVSFERFESLKEAEAFINQRYQQKQANQNEPFDPNDHYTLIEGEKLTLIAKEFITKITAE